MRDGVTLVIPTIPPRRQLLGRALASATTQIRPFSDIIICVDLDKEGAGPTRTRGLRAVSTKWVAFLDDDDELYPSHLEVLIHAALAHDADLVYPWFDVQGGSDPFPMFEGRPWDPDHPHMFPITVLARTELMQAQEGFLRKPSELDPAILEGEDWVMWLSIMRAGGKILHVPQRTWRWNHGSGNTSGRSDRW